MLPGAGFSTMRVIAAIRGSAASGFAVSTMPQLPMSSAGTSMTPIADASTRVATSTICRITGTCASIRSSARMTANGSSPTTGAAHSTAWPSPSASDCRM